MRIAPFLPLLALFWFVPGSAMDVGMVTADGGDQRGSLPRDDYSNANLEHFRQRRIDLSLVVDFTQRRIAGSVHIELERLDPDARTVVLDTRQLDVGEVGIVEDGRTRSLDWRLGEEDPIRGRALLIDLPAAVPQPLLLAIRYETRPEASGLQWVAPEQTAGGEAPFLYTQSQAIHARTWVPLQDTPAVRFRYEATVEVPAGLRAVMAARPAGEPGSAPEPDAVSGWARYHFSMPQPIPSYLLALAAGDLAFRAVGERTGIYAEPSVIEAAAEEFADTERMLETAEKLFGPYRWGRYDLLILPPSYPYGGMENPRLSFITPTVIAGDRSLVSLIAHELAHSWSGNLVTNASWEDLWLNEGFTTFLEARLMEALYGERRRRQEDLLGYRSLLEDLETLPPAEQRLAAELDGANPDDAFSAIPYEKGKLFLVWLEARFGRRELDRFLNRYFDEFAFSSITTEQFLAYLDEHLVASQPAAVSDGKIHEWVYEEGLPDTSVVPAQDVFAGVGDAARRWLAGELGATDIDTRVWSTQDWLYFLGSLPERMSRERLEALDEALGLTASGNSEILSAWLKIVAASGYQPAFPRLRQFLIRIGRLKYLEPIYERLIETPEGLAFARNTFEIARPGYHPQTVRDIGRILAAGGAG